MDTGEGVNCTSKTCMGGDATSRCSVNVKNMTNGDWVFTLSNVVHMHPAPPVAPVLTSYFVEFER